MPHRQAFLESEPEGRSAVSMITAHSDIRPRAHIQAARRLPIGIYWLLAVAMSLALWAALIRATVSLFA